MAERRSTSPSPTRSRDNIRFSDPNVFSDENALDLSGVRGGYNTGSPEEEGSNDVPSPFRAADAARRSLSLQRGYESPVAAPRRSGLTQRSDESNRRASQTHSRSSTISSHPIRDPTVGPTSGRSRSGTQRSSRTASSLGFLRPQSVYQGASGPSQPYGMYPQDISLTRTPSVATTSTLRRPERSYSGPRGPTQPYGMYAQNTSSDGGPDLISGQVPNIQAGFPGRDQTFQRRLGPEGTDVDDLIGPDGYMEQLPPYTRHAYGVPPRYTSYITSDRSPSVEPPLFSQNSQPTSRTSHNPSHTSVEPSSRPQGQTETLSPFGDSAAQLYSSTNSTSDIASPDTPSQDEGGHFKEKFRRESKRRFCCGLLPCWLLAVIVGMLMAIALGAVIGAVISHKHGDNKGVQVAGQTYTANVTSGAPTAVPSTNEYQDVMPLTTYPSGTPLPTGNPLPTGSFSITLGGGSAVNVSSSCLINGAQANTWDCATGADLAITVSIQGDNSPIVAISNPPPSDSRVRYGAQPPQLSGQLSMTYEYDNTQPNNGPAWNFVQEYNKTVIISSDDLPGPSASSKRSFLRRWFLDEHEVAYSGSIAKRISSSYDNEQYCAPQERPWYCFWNATVLQGFIYTNISTATDSNESAGEYGPQRRGASGLYPKLVKIEERRRRLQRVNPYCQQMIIQDNNQPTPAIDSISGAQITLSLEESEPKLTRQLMQNAAAAGFPPPDASSAVPTGSTDYRSKRNDVDKRGLKTPTPSCLCQWFSGYE